MPKKAVAIFFLLALLGAILFVYFTFPRTKDEIPTSNNQRPFPSAPAPGPNGLPVPETVPHPNTPVNPHGPSLRIMTWATAKEAKVLEAEADAFAAQTGLRASLTIDDTQSDYQNDLKEAMASSTPPDVFLISARDFSGFDPNRDLAEVTPPAGTVPRSIEAFTVGGHIRAVPDEFSVDILYYNPAHFDRASIGYPGPHWNWDILESMAQALGSFKMRDDAGQPVYPLEVTPDFDLWNMLSMQAGHAALDLDEWHLTNSGSKDSQIRALDFIQQCFHDLNIAAPTAKVKRGPGSLFAQQRASLLIAPSELTASLPKFPYQFTLLPRDMAQASLAQVHGWAVTSHSPQLQAALALASFLGEQSVHAGWSSTQKPKADAPDALCYQALDESLLPRIDRRTAPLAQFLDQQIGLLALNADQKTDALYARIQAQYQNGFAPPAVAEGAELKPSPKVDAGSHLRGL